jgi:hypothetical protein
MSANVADIYTVRARTKINDVGGYMDMVGYQTVGFTVVFVLGPQVGVYLLPLMTALAGNTIFFETYLGILFFFGMAESHGSGLVKHLPQVPFTVDSSSSGGDNAPSERNFLLLLEDRDERVALLREGDLDQSPLISLMHEL